MKKILILVAVAAIVLLAYRFYPRRNEWVCEKGKWIKYGNPTAVRPLTGCGEQGAGLTVLPNPAEEFCNQKGYRVEYRTDANGIENGFCQTGDKAKECEMESFMAGQCQLP